jgi:1-acyl-sn-glycerol-3-phosphate acyltransferase
MVPIWGWALRYGHFIMIDRSNPRAAMQSIDRAAETIRKGKSVLLFAEGTRTMDGRLQPFKRGAFSIAVKAGAPVVPVTINNTFKIMPKGSLNIQATDISLILDKPISTEHITDKSGEQLLMAAVQGAIENNYIDQSQG